MDNTKIETANQSFNGLEPDFGTIPDELRNYAQWVVFKAVWRHNRWTKPPKQAVAINRDAKVNDPSTWTDFNSVAFSYDDHRDALDGIGFVVTADDDIFGIDLDHCRDPDTGEAEPWSTDIIKLMGSYTEVSPSGTGYRIICTGSLPPAGRKNGNIECYESGRYFTITGHHVEGTPSSINERTKEAAAFHAQYMISQGKETATAHPSRDEIPSPVRSTDTPPPSSTATVTDDDLLNHAFNTWKNGQQIRNTFNGLNVNGDASAADQKLCDYLATILDRDRLGSITHVTDMKFIFYERWGVVEISGSKKPHDRMGSFFLAMAKLNMGGYVTCNVKMKSSIPIAIFDEKSTMSEKVVFFQDGMIFQESLLTGVFTGA